MLATSLTATGPHHDRLRINRRDAAAARAGEGDGVRTFDPSEHMREPFRAFLEATERCAREGYLVAIGPDTADAPWEQQLLIIPESRCLNLRHLEHKVEGTAS